MKYRIRFYGVPLGSLNAAAKRYVYRTVEAETVEAARLDAYRTHEHIHGTILCDLPCETCDSRDCNQCAGTGWISSARLNSGDSVFYNSPDSLDETRKVIFVY